MMFSTNIFQPGRLDEALEKRAPNNPKFDYVSSESHLTTCFADIHLARTSR